MLSFRIDLLISLLSKGLLRVFSNTTVQKQQFSMLSFLYSPTLTPAHDYWKNHTFDYTITFYILRKVDKVDIALQFHKCGNWDSGRLSIVNLIDHCSAIIRVNFSLYLSTFTMEKAIAPHSSTLAWKIPWTEEPGRLQSMGSWRVGYDWVTSLSLFTFMHWRRK